MKKILLSLTFLLCLGFISTAQTSFSDDMESYAVGDLIGIVSTDWTTWGAMKDGSDDAPITDEQAASGTQSLRLFSSATTGGPADVVLPFGALTDGTFNYNMNMYVEGGTGAYFNFQANPVIGQVWALEVFCTQGGDLILRNQEDGIVLTNTFEHDTWFNISFEVIMEINAWSVSIDGTLLGSFENTNNRIASLDLYPVNSEGTSLYYVDDVAFTHGPTVLPALDAGIVGVSAGTSVTLTGNAIPVSGKVKNLGMTDVTSFDVTLEVGGVSTTESFTGLSLATGASHDFTWPTLIDVAGGANDIVLTVSNINGGDDDNAVNNTGTTTVSGVTPAPDKAILCEEATGTWCQFCPRGAVFMDSMAHTYPDYFVGIAVHNADPMAVTAYDLGLRTLPGFPGFPSAVIDRGLFIDPSAIEPNMFNRLVQPASAVITNGAEYDENTRMITLTVKADFTADVTGEFRLNAIIAEDGVTGTDAGYNQVNAYAGGTVVMGGYENLPNPVPAADMVYNHVGRALLGGFRGAQGSLPADGISAGESHIWEFSYELPAEYDYDNIHLIGVLISSDGSIDNVKQNTIDEAVANGLFTSNNDVFANSTVELFPNPASQQTNIHIEIDGSKELQVQIMSASGALIGQKDYGTITGDVVLPLSVMNLPNGMYFVKMTLDGQSTTKKITVAK